MSRNNTAKPLSEKKTFPRKALIIQNNPVYGDQLSWMLNEAGYSVTLLPRSCASLLIMDKLHPDFIILGEDVTSERRQIKSLSALSYSLLYPLFLVRKTARGVLSVRKLQPKNMPEREADSEVLVELQSIINSREGLDQNRDKTGEI